jgi:flagellin
MGIRISTNSASINAVRNLQKAESAGTSLQEKVSSGSRVNRAGDDAAVLSISENLKARIRSQSQGVRNAHETVNMLQVADGGMQEISNLVIRLRELAIQAANGTLGSTERQIIDQAAQNLIENVDSIARSTTYNGKKLLSSDSYYLEVELGNSTHPSESTFNIDRSKLNVTRARLGLDGIDLLTQESSGEALGLLDSALKAVSGRRATIGAKLNEMDSTIRNSENQIANNTSSNSQMRDADFATETAELLRNKIQLQSGTAVLAQANQMSAVALRLLG